MKHIFVLFYSGFLVSVAVGLPAQGLDDIIRRAAKTNNSYFSVDDEDATLEFVPLVRKYGYEVEVHEVVTEDGYVLTQHRIQNPKCTQGNKPVVFLQHGILSSSFDWVITGPGNSLAYILADCCYDVWLGNFRGNVHSTNHVSLGSDKHKFWDFSWHEMADYDLPSSIKYILEKTGQKDLSYVGHSQGTTAFFAFCGTHPEWCKKVNAFIALAPVAFFKCTESLLLKFLALFSGPLDVLLDMFGVDQFAPTSAALAQLGGLLCKEESKFSPICANVLFILCGWDTELFDASLLPVLMGHSPAGSSRKQLMHYGQCMKSNKFRQYDYGLIENLLKYGSISPPDYDLSKVHAPCYLIYGNNDNFAEECDVLHLWNSLPRDSKAELYKVPFDGFNHLDFMFAKGVKGLVYDKVVDIINQKNGKDCCNC